MVLTAVIHRQAPEICNCEKMDKRPTTLNTIILKQKSKLPKTLKSSTDCHTTEKTIEEHGLVPLTSTNQAFRSTDHQTDVAQRKPSDGKGTTIIY